jgi:hypothetical protein
MLPRAYAALYGVFLPLFIACTYFMVFYIVSVFLAFRISSANIAVPLTFKVLRNLVLIMESFG